MKKPRNLAAEFRGLGRILVEATRDATTLVEDMHHVIGGGPVVFGRPLLPFVKLTSGPVYSSIRGVTRLAGLGVDRALAQLEPVFLGRTPSAEYDLVRAALNGVIGDYLVEQGNPLAIEMELRTSEGRLDLTREELAKALPDASNRVVIMLHGSAMDEVWTTRHGHNHAERLGEELGITPVFLRYNTGLHISSNGRAFSEMLEVMVEAWPVPVESVVLLGFSMGGLVARSAVCVAKEENLQWVALLKAMVFMGTPHHGAPLERYGNLLESMMGLSRYSSPLKKVARLRSAGITDLRYGSILDADWQGRDRFAWSRDLRGACKLPDVACFAVAGTTSADLRAASLASDGMVPVVSALGVHERAEYDLEIPDERRMVAARTRHLDLLGSHEVYEQILEWVRGVVGTES